MNLLKRSLYVFAAYIVLDILFLTMVLPSAARDNIHYIVSVATIYIVASTLYGYSWKCGRKDIRTIEASIKHDSDYNGKFNPYYGFLIALPFTVVNVILDF